MTEKEFEMFRMTEEETKGFPKIELETREDEFGIYSTGWFGYRKKRVLVESQNGIWHLAVVAPHPLGLHEIKEIRRIFMPDKIEVALILPSRMNPINDTASCIHLFELEDAEPKAPEEPKATNVKKTAATSNTSKSKKKKKK